MTVKRSKPSKKEKKPTTNEEWDYYLDLKANQIAPASDQFMERTGLKLYLWATENENALKIGEFATLVGIGRETLLRWKKKNAKFSEYFDEAKQAIGDRRERGAVIKDFDSSMIKTSMAFYDPEWEAHETRRAQMGSNVDGNGGTKIVVIEKFEETK